MRLVNFLRRATVPFFWEVFRRMSHRQMPKYGLEGDYRSWGEALQVCTGYQASVILEKTKSATIALGLAHEHEIPFIDFGCEHFIITPEHSIESTLDLIRGLVDYNKNAFCGVKNAGKLEELRTINQGMWDRVTDLSASTTGETLSAIS